MQLRAHQYSNLVEILVDQVTYAVIEGVDSVHKLDVEKIADWVNNTCYNNDHLCEAYMPCYLRFEEFKLD